MFRGFDIASLKNLELKLILKIRYKVQFDRMRQNTVKGLRHMVSLGILLYRIPSKSTDHLFANC